MEEKKVRPQDKWDAKAGLVSKTYKVDEKVAEEFRAVCKKQKELRWGRRSLR